MKDIETVRDGIWAPEAAFALDRIERVYRVAQDIAAAETREPVSDAHEWQAALREAFDVGREV